MKNFVSTLIILFAVFFLGYQYVYAAPCKRPIEYAIGSVDPKFGVSKEQLLSDLKRGETVWEKAVGKNLFDYQPSAKFKVNLIYDERQRNVLQKQRTESGLDAMEQNFKNADAKFSALKVQYESASAVHDKAVADFQRQQAEYESQVQYWNGRGGAPKSEYAKLESERQSLNSQASNLNTETSKLNSMSSELNALLQQRNEAARQYNSLVNSYNSKFGSGLEFDQAEYKSNPQTINVYEFKSNDDLTLALTHELGHALGLGHVDDPQSIMYYLTNGQTLEPTAADLAELKSVCKIK